MHGELNKNRAAQSVSQDFKIIKSRTTKKKNENKCEGVCLIWLDLLTL